jgi:hypothetical protein
MQVIKIAMSDSILRSFAYLIRERASSLGGHSHIAGRIDAEISAPLDFVDLEA